MCKPHRYLIVALIMSSASLLVVAQPGKRNVNGKIAFVHRDNNMQKIYVIRARGCSHQPKVRLDYKAAVVSRSLDRVSTVTR